MTEYKRGQRLKVTMEVTYRNRRVLWHSAITQDGGVLYFKEGDGVTVEVMGAADWPPQAGDVWEADGTQWFCRNRGSDSNPGSHWMVPVRSQVGMSVDELKDLNPVLVWRRGQ